VVITKKYWLIIYGSSLAIFLTGLIIWLTARLYQPVTPSEAPVRHIDVGKIPPVYPLDRYRSLMGGRLFFGGNDPSFNSNGGPKVPQFGSRMVLWGVIKGGRAVIGFDPNSNLETKLVKVGDVIEGEKIVAIGDKYIEIKNQTGQGRIWLTGEK
jgi:hypothetical protein